MAIEDYFKKEEALINEYEALKSDLTRWGSFVDNHIMKLIKESSSVNHEHIEIFPKARLKGDTSLIRKAFYRNKEELKNPLLVSDKIATRVVVTTREDIEPIRDLILKETSIWKAHISRQLGEEMPYHPKEFDYDSLHLTLIPTLNNELFCNFNDSQLVLYACEVQIRTLLQHAFAQVSHDTVYKGPFSESPKIIRTLSTCMALMEVVDKYFSSAIEEMRKDSEIEVAYIKRLIKLGNTHLMAGFKVAEIDFQLNYSLLRLFKGLEIDIDELEQTIIRDSANVKILLNTLNSYLSHQPILLLLAFYIINRREKYLHDYWPLNESILKEVIQKLGHAYSF